MVARSLHINSSDTPPSKRVSASNCIFSSTRLITLVLTFVFVSTAASPVTAIADGAPQTDALKVRPDKCISLSQGLICYQRVRFEWSQRDVGDYCLIEESAADPIVCWAQLRSGSHITEFASQENKNYYLINQADKRRVGSVTLQVAWVYRSKKRSRGRWRLF